MYNYLRCTKNEKISIKNVHPKFFDLLPKNCCPVTSGAGSVYKLCGGTFRAIVKNKNKTSGFLRQRVT
jgi:hypothetical protein